MDNNNQFVVDLGELKLDDDHRKRISAAIQKAVASELGNMRVHYTPVDAASKWTGKGPLIRGFVAHVAHVTGQ